MTEADSGGAGSRARVEQVGCSQPGPLTGILVLDLSRMLPGAVLARQLIDLGARLIKVEDPAGGDPLRHPPPHLDGISAAYSVLLRGAESLCLDLADRVDAERLRRLARHADVLIESFRPGTMAAWDLAPERVQALNPALVWCSLSAYSATPAGAGRIGHDLNLTAATGLLGTLPGHGIPSTQLADVSAALLATTAIMAGLLQRQRTGYGPVIDQPLVCGPLPFLAWAWADTAAGAGQEGIPASLLSGDCPAYRLYRCIDGKEIAVGALEPKLWSQLVRLLELDEHAGAGLDTSEEGARAAAALSRTFGSHPSSHWLELAATHALPLSAVNDIPAAQADPFFTEAGLTEATLVPGSGTLVTLGPFVPSLGRTPTRPAPRLGEHTESVLREHGLLEDGG